MAHARQIGKPCLMVALEEGIKPEAFQDMAGRQSHYRLKSKSLKKRDRELLDYDRLAQAR